MKNIQKEPKIAFSNLFLFELSRGSICLPERARETEREENTPPNGLWSCPHLIASNFSFLWDLGHTWMYTHLVLLDLEFKPQSSPCGIQHALTIQPWAACLQQSLRRLPQPSFINIILCSYQTHVPNCVLTATNYGRSRDRDWKFKHY